MLYRENPKQVGSRLLSCKPQVGKCPINCHQCYYNRPDASYIHFNDTNIPTAEYAKNKIVRMNDLHDSNIQRDLVIKSASIYEDVFFNTSIPNFDFPNPVAYTANPKEEEPVEMDFLYKQEKYLKNLMFVRLRVSANNIGHVHRAVHILCEYAAIPIILTFMAYYERPKWMEDKHLTQRTYVWKKRHINEYYCATKEFMKSALNILREHANRNRVTMCGTLESNYCKDCRNCEAYYWITKKRLSGS